MASRGYTRIHWHMAARRTSGPGHEKAADAGLGLLLWGDGQLLVTRMPWVAVSVVSSVDPTDSTAHPTRRRERVAPQTSRAAAFFES